MKLVKKILPIIIILLGLTFLLKTPKTASFEVVLTEKGFEPALITVPVGSKVVFRTNTDRTFWPASDPHPLHDVYPDFDPQKPIQPGETWTFKPKKAGEWDYHDHLFFTHRGKLLALPQKEWKERNKVLSRDEISRKIDKEGADIAYANLQKISDPSSSLAHSTFHIFGETLYQKLGVSGIGTCDSFAGFGCYHGFFLKAVSGGGIEVAKELDKKCLEKFGPMGLGCPHGIGHGLVEFLGYERLNEALSVCSNLAWQGSLFGCQGGVFMEYNFRTTFKEGESTIATRDAHGNLHEPCRSLPSRFKQACYFEQAAWWREILNADYEKIGNFCEDVVGQKEKEACFLGLGNSVTEHSGYSREAIIEACTKMPSLLDEAVCRAGASWAFFANPEKESLSQSICEGLGGYENLCLEKRILVK